MRNFRLHCVIFTLLIIGISSTSYAQWQKVIKFPTGARSIYFLDQLGHAERGFAGLNDGSIWMTTDYGVTWKREFTDIFGLSISDIAFKDSLSGWFCTAPYLVPSSVSSVYRTNDGGLTWQSIQNDNGGLYEAIYYHIPSHTLYLSVWNRGATSSNNDGITFTEIDPNTTDFSPNGFTFSDANDGLMTSASLGGGGDIYSTNDAGNNWQLFPNVHPGWQPASIAGTTSFFIFSEYSSTLKRNDGFGLPWQKVSTIGAGNQFDFTGCLRISGCTGNFYVQSATNKGIFMSPDQGVTWNTIGGPSNEVDSRFWIDGVDVFASDMNGELWVNRGIYDTIVISPQLTAGQSGKSAAVVPGKDTNLIFSFLYGIPASAGLDSFAFDLSFNSDLLNLDSANAAPGWDITINKTSNGLYHCTLNNSSHKTVAINEALAFFYFSTFLTVNTSSTVLLQNGTPFFDPADNIGCTFISKLQSSIGDAVSIQSADSCGDASLRHFLKTGQVDFSIISIRPNPAQDEIMIETQSATANDASIIIFDDLGKQWHSEQKTFSGRNISIIGISLLPAGNYHLMLKSSSGSVSSDFVKVH